MVSETITISKKLVGERVKRKEDARLLNGRGRFIDDLKLPNMHYVSILRSTYAHAKIVRIDISRAMIPGVVMIVTGKEITELSNPMMPAPAIPIKHYCMAIDKVRFVGEPVAAVVALDRYTAEDALEYITVDYEPLETVTETDEALKSGSPVLHESVGSNLAWQKNLTYGEVDKDFESADEVIKERFSVHRVSPTPIETFGVVASYEAFSNSLVIYSNTEIPGMLLNIISGSLKVPQLQLHLVNFDNGGSFGAKGGLHYLLLMSVVSIKTGLPVKFVEDRKENLLALQQGEETEYRVEAAIKKDGTILSLKVNIDENVGAYPAFPEPEGILEQLLCGAYKIRSYSLKANLVMSNKCPTGPCRGYGRYNSAFVIERTIEAVAKKYHIDPTEVRFQNFIPETEFPYKAPNGNLYDSGNYKENLMKALKLFDYEGARAQQKTAKSAGRNLGIGIGFIVEIGTPNFAHFGLVSNQPPASLLSNNTETAIVRMEPTGKVRVSSGMAPQGQGHETAISQVVADELGISYDDVLVAQGFDSATNPYTGSSGTYGSRFGGVGISAVYNAAQKLREKLLTVAGFMLGEKAPDLDIANGLIFAKNNTKKAIPVPAVAGATYYHSLILGKDIGPDLSASATFGIPTGTLPDESGRLNNGLTYSSSAHIALIEVDKETGKVKVLRYVAVDDCGKQINPMLVEGQTHGGIAHALAWSLYEEIRYNRDGELLSSTFMDYLVPSAAEVPQIEVDRIETPSPFTPLGTKGVGEGGAMPVMPIIASAIEDALSIQDSRIWETHQSPEKVWAMAKAK